MTVVARTEVSSRPQLILVGPPGSGKGTQATLLAERAGLPTLSTGELLRRVAQEPTLLGRRVADVIGSGALLPDRLMLDVLRDPLTQLRATGEGFVLDGFPRTVAQAVALDQTLAPAAIDLVVQLVVDPAVLAERLAARGRADDNAAAIEQRLRAFERETRPMIERFRCSGRLVVIDGHQPVEAVYAQIDDSIDRAIAEAIDDELSALRATRSPAPRAATLRS
jgi:adenylate kinase